MDTTIHINVADIPPEVGESFGRVTLAGFTTLYQMRSASFRLARPFFFISRNRAGLILWHQWSARLPICRAS